MQRLEDSCAVRPIYTLLGAKGLTRLFSQWRCKLTRILTDNTGRPGKFQTLYGKYYLAGRVLCKFQPKMLPHNCSRLGFFMCEATKTRSVLMHTAITFFNRHAASGKIMNLRIWGRWTWVLGECLWKKKETFCVCFFQQKIRVLAHRSLICSHSVHRHQVGLQACAK